MPKNEVFMTCRSKIWQSLKFFCHRQTDAHIHSHTYWQTGQKEDAPEFLSWGIKSKLIQDKSFLGRLHTWESESSGSVSTHMRGTWISANPTKTWNPSSINWFGLVWITAFVSVLLDGWKRFNCDIHFILMIYNDTHGSNVHIAFISQMLTVSSSS